MDTRKIISETLKDSGCDPLTMSFDQLADEIATAISEDQMTLGTILSALYASEINVSISCFWDGGWEVKLGDEMNGFQAERQFPNQEIGKIADWLTLKAKELYPKSVFAAVH